MANYRIDGDDFQKNYQRQRKTLSERKDQPRTVPMGNYRIDQEGNPILPEVSTHTQSAVHLEDLDYFNQPQAVEDATNLQENVYELDAYRQTRSEHSTLSQARTTLNTRRVYTEPTFEGIIDWILALIGKRSMKGYKLWLIQLVIIQVFNNYQGD